MFFVGLGIVLVYTFFLIGIISKQNKAVKKQTPLEVDVLDMDGMGNHVKSPNPVPSDNSFAR